MGPGTGVGGGAVGPLRVAAAIERLAGIVHQATLNAPPLLPNLHRSSILGARRGQRSADSLISDSKLARNVSSPNQETRGRRSEDQGSSSMNLFLLILRQVLGPYTTPYGNKEQPFTSRVLSFTPCPPEDSLIVCHNPIHTSLRRVNTAIAAAAANNPKNAPTEQQATLELAREALQATAAVGKGAAMPILMVQSLPRSCQMNEYKAAKPSAPPTSVPFRYCMDASLAILRLPCTNLASDFGR